MALTYSLEDVESYTEAFKAFFLKKWKSQLYGVLKQYPRKKSVEVDFRAVERFDPALANLILEHPDAARKSAEKSIEDLNIELRKGSVFKPHVRFFNIPDYGLMIENLSSDHINKMITLKVLVSRRGDVMHKVKVATIVCTSCNEVFRIPVKGNESLPKKCPSCKKGILRQDLEVSKFVDFQLAEVQDLLERVRPGTPAAKIFISLEDDLVNTIVPGENIQITGVLKIDNLKLKKKQSNVFSRYIEVHHIRSLKRDFEEIEVSKEEEEEILKLASQPDVEERIINSIAPDIFGHENIKRALALQLFGGTRGKKTASGHPLRDDIHILLVGDPGIAKTRFLQHVVRLAPKSIYVSGKSVTGVGLTASVERDELSGGGWTLKAGALVLASGGIAAIDEFDKIDDEDRAALHEVMESQTVSIAKAGIVAKFRAKTAIIAAANPKFGRFLTTKNIADQFNIPPSLLSRFDLIFPIFDRIDLEEDKKLAEHILNTHIQAGQLLMEGESSGGEKLFDKVLPAEFLRKYIAYARQNIKPVLSEEASRIIKEFYLEMRELGKVTGTVPITPRYLEGLIRLAEANAKMRLSNVVEERDAKVATDLMRYVMDEVMKDKETGVYDVDTISTGTSINKKKKLADLIDLIKDLEKKYDRVEIDVLVEEAKSVLDLSEREVREYIERLKREGDIYEIEPGIIKTV